MVIPFLSAKSPGYLHTISKNSSSSSEKKSTAHVLCQLKKNVEKTEKVKTEWKLKCNIEKGQEGSVNVELLEDILITLQVRKISLDL